MEAQPQAVVERDDIAGKPLFQCINNLFQRLFALVLHPVFYISRSNNFAFAIGEAASLAMYLVTGPILQQSPLLTEQGWKT
jgi:hypothetical protein